MDGILLLRERRFINDPDELASLAGDGPFASREGQALKPLFFLFLLAGEKQRKEERKKRKRDEADEDLKSKSEEAKIIYKKEKKRKRVGKFPWAGFLWRICICLVLRIPVYNTDSRT